MNSDPTTVAQVLRGRREYGDKPLLICDDERLSYADADARSAALAASLLTLGVGKGTHVGLLYPNGAEFVVAMLAASRIGAVVVPFSTFSTAPELLRQLADAEVAIMLAARSFRSHDFAVRLAEALSLPAGTQGPIFTTAAPVLRHVLFTGDAAPGDVSLVRPMEDDVDGSDVLSVIYTSGSMSIPKGVVHTHAALMAHQRELNRIRGLTAADRLFCNSPFFWIGGFAFGLLATLVAGATLICSNASDAGATLDLLEAEKPTITNGFVATIAHLTRHPSFPGRDLSSMRRGNLYPIMAPEARPVDSELRHSMLGMTEAGSVVLISSDETDQPETRRGSFGFLAPGFEARLIHPEGGDDVAPDEVGELLIRGPALMQHYYGRTREECFDADGWFHTGDLLRRDGDGVFYFAGRAGAMIKTAGANVAPSEVETALTPLVRAVDESAIVYVVGLPDPERGQIVAAAIATDTGELFDTGALRRSAVAQLSAYKLPRRWLVLQHDAVPMLSAGKLDLPALRKLFDA
ncbi:acyl-CoA synthetase (AMP-forming)/AMP-acid ligase II [Mycolicibacterium chubuense NBB4]|uniref:Acyl-CoA synthetase (AMP-forming)/AMP-acid ligase II n=1 Tax=Mycolicibacterium chubuense (strain NBB4) TaxID=710421 RepID=I4BGV9_MYCCN|nr:class I adenylate-forming enzyme family protein [Mycolicibacterium chubuense]AFM16516.1 acyl-CoA synthetase (AMP-forming)/AMP-acid ligase II [Mycolicibacterium chubuense NBB4]